MPKIISFLIITLIFINISNAQRNYKYENFGNRSILLNGNVTGSVDDLGATYYNPARLALVKDPVFSLSAQMYEVSKIKIKNLYINGENVKNSQFKTLPGMIAGTFKLKFLENHQFAYSIISKNRSTISIRYITDLLSNNNGDTNKYVSEIELDNYLKEIWYGISWAKSLNKNFSIGASIFASFYKYNARSNQKFTSFDVYENVALYNKNITLYQKSTGIFSKISAAWVYSNIDFGLTIDLPYLEIFKDGSFLYEEYLSGAESVDDIFIYNNFRDVDTKRKYPFGISIGAGIPYKKHRLHANMSWNPAISSYKKLDIPPLESQSGEEVPVKYYEEELRAVLNLGLGGEFFINNSFNIYGSFSTDFSPYKVNSLQYNTIDETSRNINFESNYYHIGAGINYSHKWANVILGSVYSVGNSEIPNPLDNPIGPNGDNFANNNIKNATISRWRFIVGLEILFLNKVTKKTEDKP